MLRVVSYYKGAENWVYPILYTRQRFLKETNDGQYEFFCMYNIMQLENNIVKAFWVVYMLIYHNLPIKSTATAQYENIQCTEAMGKRLFSYTMIKELTPATPIPHIPYYHSSSHLARTSIF